jgi:hypothetical protein
MGAALGPLGALGGGLLGAGMAWWQGNEASKLQRQQADLQRQTTDEQVRRATAGAEQQMGLGRAAAAASGLDFNSTSLQGYLSAMNTELRAQIDWTRQAGYAQADAMQRGADLSSSANNWAAAGDIGSTLFKFGASNGWFRPTAPAKPGGVG